MEDDERDEILGAATEMLEFAAERTSEFDNPQAACAFALAVATAVAADGSLNRAEFLELMADVWDRIDRTEPSMLN